MKDRKHINAGKAEGSSKRKGQQRFLQACGLADLPIVDCRISCDWLGTGTAHILIAREADNKRLVVGGFLVDIMCRGLKDTAILYDISPSDYKEKVIPSIFDDPVELVDCRPELARKIIEGAIAFASGYGFRPKKFWSKSKEILRGIESCADDVEFGKNGKPHLVLKKGEVPEAFKRRLTRTAGAGNFTMQGPDS